MKARKQLTYALTATEETIYFRSEVIMITNCQSFQNLCPHTLRWSRIPFSDENKGAIIETHGERIFSASSTIFIKSDDGMYEQEFNSTLKEIHVRSTQI